MATSCAGARPEHRSCVDDTHGGLATGKVSTDDPRAPLPPPHFAVWWNAVWVSVAGAPWTLGTVTVVNPTTGTAGSATGMATGFMHGPLSNTTTVAQTGGLLQIVTPMSVQLGRSNGLDYRDEGSIGYIGKLTLRFIPEPGQLLLLGTGVLALVVMGWRRHRP